MAKAKLISVFFMVGLATLFLIHVNTKHINKEFLCAENGHNISDDTSVAIIGEWGYYADGQSLTRWNVDTGIVDQIKKGFFYQLFAYEDELYYYDGKAVIAWNPLTAGYRVLYQVPNGEIHFRYFPYHGKIFCLFLDHVTVLDILSGDILFTWDDISVSNTTFAVMNGELYFWCIINLKIAAY